MGKVYEMNETAFVCDDCHYRHSLRPKVPADSKGASWFCGCCGHHCIGSVVPIGRRHGHIYPIPDMPISKMETTTEAKA